MLDTFNLKCTIINNDYNRIKIDEKYLMLFHNLYIFLDLITVASKILNFSPLMKLFDFILMPERAARTRKMSIWSLILLLSKRMTFPAELNAHYNVFIAWRKGVIFSDVPFNHAKLIHKCENCLC